MLGLHNQIESTETLVINGFKDTRNVTKTDKTKQAYNHRAILLLKKVGRLYNNDETIVDPRQVVIWLKENTHTFTKNTFRQYKSALIFYFTEVIKTPVSLEAAEYLMTLTGEIASYKSDKTSSKKAKNLNKTNYQKMINYLLRANGKYDQIIICWLQAGLLCGLRPSEWRTAEFIEHNGEIALKVLNGKNTNGRANGDNRILTLGGMTESELNVIKQQLYNIKSNCFDDNTYQNFYAACATRLTHVNNELFGKTKSKHITLYSARHQFSANAKSANVGREVLAAMMGHALDHTAAIHYGKKHYGTRAGVKVKPIPEQVETVKKTQNYENFVTLKEKMRQEKMSKIAEHNQELPIFTDDSNSNSIQTNNLSSSSSNGVGKPT